MKRSRMLATRIAATATSATGSPLPNRIWIAARSLRQKSRSMRAKVGGLTFQVSPLM
jgi:hypothetical protein